MENSASKVSLSSAVTQRVTHAPRPAPVTLRCSTSAGKQHSIQRRTTEILSHPTPAHRSPWAAGPAPPRVAFLSVVEVLLYQHRRALAPSLLSLAKPTSLSTVRHLTRSRTLSHVQRLAVRAVGPLPKIDRSAGRKLATLRKGAKVGVSASLFFPSSPAIAHDREPERATTRRVCPYAGHLFCDLASFPPYSLRAFHVGFAFRSHSTFSLIIHRAL